MVVLVGWDVEEEKITEETRRGRRHRPLHGAKAMAEIQRPRRDPLGGRRALSGGRHPLPEGGPLPETTPNAKARNTARGRPRLRFLRRAVGLSRPNEESRSPVLDEEVEVGSAAVFPFAISDAIPRTPMRIILRGGTLAPRLENGLGETLFRSPPLSSDGVDVDRRNGLDLYIHRTKTWMTTRKRERGVWGMYQVARAVWDRGERYVKENWWAHGHGKSSHKGV